MKLKRVLSLLMALVMTVSLMTLPVHAEDNDFASLTVAEQYASLKSVDNEADAQALFNTLTEAQQTALVTYAQTQADAEVTKEEYPIPAVNYTNVAPFVQTEKAAATEVKALKKSLMMSTRATNTPVAPTPITGESPDGLVLHKTATVNDNDSSYTIKLEAYTTGSVTSVDTTKPTDIIFVLDQSGSMAYDMTSYTYAEAYPGSNHSGTYYVQSGGSYVKVTWCSDCGAWTDGCTDFIWHFEGEQYSPKTSSEDNETGHVQFYSQTGTDTVIRLDALKNAMTNFAASVADKCAGADKQPGTADDVDHRVAVVGFSSDGYDNTELLTGCSITTGSDNYGTEPVDTYNSVYYYPTGYAKNGVQYSSITNDQYAAALLSMKGKPGRDGVTAAIDALTAHGGTQTLDGLTMAEEILKNSDGTDRNRVVVLFTDGDTNSTRADVVNKAHSLKNTYNATVYTVGIFENANGQPPITDSTTDANALMHRISSNYPNATAVSIYGEDFWGNKYIVDTDYTDNEQNPNLKEGESYYLSAGDADALNNIFQKISQQMSESSINLGSTVQIKDIVSPYFNMPANTAAVSVKSYDCTAVSNGEPTWSSTGTTQSDAVTIDTATRAVNVTGFDFNHNFVAENGRDENDPTKGGNFRGRKLEITFTVTPKDGFWGGNNVPTNGTDSGVYAADGTKIATFDVPTVNVPLEIPDLTASDKNIYLLGTAPTASDLGTFAVPTGDDAWKVAYVNIGQIKADKEISNTVDTENINLSVTVTPKYTGDGAEGVKQQAVRKTATANVNVFTPEVNFKDSTIYRGNTANYSINQTGAPVWKHRNTVDKEVDMSGTAPALTYSYDKGEDAFEDCTNVNVTVKIGSTNVTDKTTGDKLFTVHVLQPVITATVNDVERYYGESYTLGDGANGAINLTWTDNHNHNAIPAVTGTMPYDVNELSLAYSANAFSGTVPASDFDVTVKVMKGDDEMPATITTTCTHGCGEAQADCKYTVHVKTCTLTIKKSGCDTDKDANQSFIFDVTGPKTMQVTVQENGTAKIVGLPVGDYTVTEDGNWSWRYTAQNTGDVTLSAVNHDAKVTINNDRTDPDWLSGDSYAVNYVGCSKAQGTFVGA